MKKVNQIQNSPPKCDCSLSPHTPLNMKGKICGVLHPCPTGTGPPTPPLIAMGEERPHHFLCPICLWERGGGGGGPSAPAFISGSGGASRALALMKPHSWREAREKRTLCTPALRSGAVPPTQHANASRLRLAGLPPVTLPPRTAASF